jgi:hypothetical protein
MTDHLTQLGRLVDAPARPEDAILERVPNPQADTLYLARFAAPEFTSLCPVTGQPDFAHLVIDYAPGEWLIESKSHRFSASKDVVPVNAWRGQDERSHERAPGAPHRHTPRAAAQGGRLRRARLPRPAS